MFPASQINAEIAELEVGQPLMSFGCNDGDDPTRLDTKLVDIDRYDGPPNFVCSVDPISGRSGGGLFGIDGQLMGVCSCADRKSHEGLYAAHGAILELVKYCELTDILKSARNGVNTGAKAALGEDPSESFKQQMAAPAATTPAVPAPLAKPAVANAPVSSASQLKFFDTDATADTTPDDLLELPKSAASVARARPSAPPLVSTTSVTTGPEITILIDDKTGGEPRRIVIPQASAWMLEMLTGEPAETDTSVTSTLRPVRTNPVNGR